MTLLWVAFGMRLKFSCLWEGASTFMGFPGGSAGKESAWNTGDLGFIPGLGRSPAEGKGYPLQYCGLKNSMDSPRGRKDSETTERRALQFPSLTFSGWWGSQTIWSSCGLPTPLGWDWPTFSRAEGTFLSPCSQLDNSTPVLGNCCLNSPLVPKKEGAALQHRILQGREKSWVSLGLQGDPTSPSQRKPALKIHWKDWGWSSSTLATWCEELTHWKRPWCWNRLKAGK